ncbi:hypothetical protein SDC9_152252 [bioreactor metagenome]|uniref:Uncharacterized protein n=1 Tax=bioreactor metagenome TaxID=1076179 RepID=A0A645EWX5_9ZZZZ
MGPVFHRVDGLKLAYVQHPPNHAAQAAALLRNNLQVLLFAFIGDGPVQNAVGIPGDGGHGGFQLVRDVGDKLPALSLRLQQRLCHIVKRNRQLADFIVSFRVPHADVKLSVGKPPGGGHHLPDGPNLPHGGDGGSHKRHHQYHAGGHDKQANKALPHFVQRRVKHGHDKHRAHRFPRRIRHRNAHHKVLFRIHSAQIGAAGTHPLRQGFVHQVPGDGDGQPVQPRVGGKEGTALRVADEKIQVGYGRGKASQR